MMLSCGFLLLGLATSVHATPYYSCIEFSPAVWSVVCAETTAVNVNPPPECRAATDDFCEYINIPPTFPTAHYLSHPTDSYYSYTTGGTGSFAGFNYVEQLPSMIVAQQQCEAKAAELNQLCEVGTTAVVELPPCTVFQSTHFLSCPTTPSSELVSCLLDFSSFAQAGVQPYVSKNTLECFNTVVGVPDLTTEGPTIFDDAISFGTAATLPVHDPFYTQVTAPATACEAYRQLLISECFAPLCSLLTHSGSSSSCESPVPPHLILTM
jgi:hypothetical protein